VLALLRDSGQTVVMVTHDPVAAAYAERVVFLADGRIAGELLSPTREQVAERLTELACV
jgi:putative ABC transport system ATP-binding protein